jgi:DNA-binding XRE family transcriptional regulator
MITNELKKLRMQKYMMNKKEFCHFIGVVEQQYGRYENMTSHPSLEVALRISKALDLTVNEIWKLDE